MKKQLYVFAMVFGLSAIGAASLQAQSRETANIPFDFQVGGTKLAAGAWEAAFNTANGVLLLSNRDTLQSVMISAPLAKAPDQSRSELVFRKYGTQYFLAEIWFPGEPGHCTMKSKAEKEYAAATRVKPELTLVAAR